MGAVNVRSYGAIGDGVKDDTAALRTAMSASGRIHLLTSDPGKTFLISSTLVLPTGQGWAFNGSAIKKAPTMTGSEPAVRLAGGNHVEGLVVDGNRTAGTKGGNLELTGAENVVKDCRSDHSYANAYYVASGSTTFENCVAEDVDDGLGAGGSAVGFAGGATPTIMRCINCRAYTCARSGFLPWGTGAFFDGCYATRCGYGLSAPVSAADDNCHVGNFICEDNDRADFYFEGANGWTIDYLESRDVSKKARDSSASAVQMNNCDEFSIGTIVALRPPGYGLALAGGSSRNRIGFLLIDSTDGWDSDPGLHCSGGACGNHIGNVYLRGSSYAVVIGEGIAGSNDDNHIGSLTAVDNSYGALRIDRGKFNRVDQVFARGCSTTYPDTGLIDFSTADTTDNSVGFLDQSSPGAKPKYVVHFDAQASGNHVLDGFGRDYVTAAVLDENGGNVGTLR